jgi:hypothetical protein
VGFPCARRFHHRVILRLIVASCDAVSLNYQLESSSTVSAETRTRWSRFYIASLGAVLLLAATIYGLPWMVALPRNRTGLPPIFGADFYSYLVLSRIFTLSGIPDHDPWYGVPIAAQFGHSTFRTAFVLFGFLRSALGSELLASVVWSVGWSLLIACSLWLLLKAVLKNASGMWLFTGTSLLIFFNLTALALELAAWTHPFNSVLRKDLLLPYVRMFFPQIAIPQLAFYFLSCMRAWEHNRPQDYAWMAAIQVSAFLTFPYASVFIALATATFLLLNLRTTAYRSRFLGFASVAIVSLIADVTYVLFSGRHGGSGAAGAGSLLKLDFTQLRVDFGGTVVLLLVLAAVLRMLRSREIGISVVLSLGLANALMLLADCVVDPRYLVSHHAGYFAQMSLGLELCALCWYLRKAVWPSVFRVGVVAIAVMVLCNGVAASWGSIQENAEANAKFSDFAAAMAGLHLNTEDLLIAPAKYVDDASTIVPLMSNAHVLFMRNAEILLGASGQQVQTERQAIYLFLTGIDADWVSKALSGSKIPTAVLTLGEGFALHDPGKRDEISSQVRETLLPPLIALQHGARPPLLRQAHRILVLDDAASPAFDNSRINQLLAVGSDYESGRLRVRICTAR